ncbi:DinB superfamily protein [Mesobacillus persicus]|uniref:Putative metal-dependent hydrolase SAMN05192533_101399 n=1 Tax=Mesobacillus persicus TaxID=930146 RepID=A0A1H7WFE4_9BACI|nr:bacillithiol transferase BstA [Mesobacillus persicus]SEM20243.1 DinB superfamily protein [Mesobacillus persicus]
MKELQYPIGPFQPQQELSNTFIESCIREIEEAPSLFRKAVEDLSDKQLDTPYRPGGWTIRQVVHHLADSHMNSFIRLKLALTEDNPTIKPYFEEKWANLADSKQSIESSLTLLEGLHSRWAYLLKSLKPADLEKTFYHPETGPVTLAMNISLYAWHSRHHLSHITRLRERMEW